MGNSKVKAIVVCEEDSRIFIEELPWETVFMDDIEDGDFVNDVKLVQRIFVKQYFGEEVANKISAEKYIIVERLAEPNAFYWYIILVLEK